jgi:hypothetical protein
VLEGNYFSPQLGVMVNGVPLKADVSIANNSDSIAQTANPAQDIIAGEFEILNSHEVIATFSMGSQYAGTPTITLVSPEKTSDINSFGLRINGNRHPQKLKDLSETDPMFREDLKIAKVSAISGRKLMLTGSGFRRFAKIFVNGVELGEPIQRSSREITVALTDPVRFGESWTIRIEQKSGQGTESAEYPYDAATAVTCHFNRYNAYTDGSADASVTVTGGDSFINSVGPTIPNEFFVSAGTRFPVHTWTGSLHISASSGSRGSRHAIHPRDVISVSVDTDLGTKSIDVPLPLIPSIAHVDKPSGVYDQPQNIVITGTNLKHVSRVYFGDTAGQILGAPGNGVLTVSVPKGPHVADGKSLKVPIRLETDINLAGQKVTNVDDLAYSAAYYEYQGHPPAKTD